MNSTTNKSYKTVSQTGTWKPFNKAAWVNVAGPPTCLHKKKVN